MNAKNLNPLSEFPGNIIIENELMQAINSVEEYYVMYFDIDNFKACLRKQLYMRKRL